MKELHYLWIEGILPELQKMCIKSYIKLGYTINFWTFTPWSIGIEHQNINFKYAGDILDNVYEHHFHYADLFRYKVLYLYGGIWIDADMYLLKTIPEDDIIISSEYCNKIGAFKKDYTNKNANIGILKFPEGDALLKKTIIQCENSKAKLTNLKFMEYFRTNLKKYNYDKYVVEPQVYCPVSWANYKEFYEDKDYPKDYKFISKYGQPTHTFEYIMKNAIGIHLWNTFFVKDKLKVYSKSFANVLKTRVDNIRLDNFDVKICIPTFERSTTINDKTIRFLEKHYIPKEKVYLFVEDKKQLKQYQETVDFRYNIIVSNTTGIGAKRNYIRNYFENGTKLLMIDDDVEDVLQFINKKTAIGIKDFKTFVNESFSIAKRNNVTMWGVCLFDNPFYSTITASTKFKFIGGTLQGILVNDISKNIKVDIDHFEDVEFSIKHYIEEGKTLRFNNIGLKHKYYSKKGGIVAHKGSIENREYEALVNATYLTGTYPNLCSITHKKDGKINIKLHDKLEAFKVEF
jgi:hypothetical protein